ncbi:MAG TPA: glutamate racemase [Chthoniobacterales bacterium]|jgi:glutamate racemase|nr:glutamate racemase [Chthoniobacterales bacterium]
MSDSRPIGVFDSGIGGLTVAKALLDVLPNEKILYLGDTARVPYGGKSAETVQRYAIELANMLIAENAKALVVACNTVSSVAIPQLRKHLDVPVIGVIEPGVCAAVTATRNRHVGIIGTRATIRSGAYETALRGLDIDLRVTSRACPLLVPLIEEGMLDDPVTDQVIARYLEPMLDGGIDTLVLGCTHYPLLAPAISRSAGENVRLVDSAVNCARAVAELLDGQSLGAPPENARELQVRLTDAPDNFLRVAREALQLDIGEIQIREVLHPAKL